MKINNSKKKSHNFRLEINLLQIVKIQPLTIQQNQIYYQSSIPLIIFLIKTQKHNSHLTKYPISSTILISFEK